MLNKLKIYNNGIKYIFNKSCRNSFNGRIFYTTSSTSEILLDAHQSCFPDLNKTFNENLFTNYSNQLKDCVFSKQEAACALKFCLELNYFEPRLFRNIVKVLEDEYFKPVLEEEANDKSHKLYNILNKDVSNTFSFINSLSIKDKAKVVIWSWLINKYGRKKTMRPKYTKTTEEVDPEKREVYVTKKTKMVLDPVPIRAALAYMPPGKKLSNTLSVQLREEVDKANLEDLCHISQIFSTQQPLTGQLNEDTIDLVSDNFCKFETTDLARNMFSLSSFCRYSTKRFHYIWSFMDPNPRRVPTRGMTLYNIESRKLPQKFIKKVLESLKFYTDQDTMESENYKSYVEETSPASVHLHILNNISNSDFPVGVKDWERLILKLESSMEEVDKFDIREIGLYCDSVMKAKFTTPKTLELAKRMLNSFTMGLEYTNEDYKLMGQTLDFILVNGLEEGFQEVVNCICTLTINNSEKLKYDEKLELVKLLGFFSEKMHESERTELQRLSSDLEKEGRPFEI